MTMSSETILLRERDRTLCCRTVQRRILCAAGRELPWLVRLDVHSFLDIFFDYFRKT